MQKGIAPACRCSQHLKSQNTVAEEVPLPTDGPNPCRDPKPTVTDRGTKVCLVSGGGNNFGFSTHWRLKLYPTRDNSPIVTALARGVHSLDSDC